MSKLWVPLLTNNRKLLNLQMLRKEKSNSLIYIPLLWISDNKGTVINSQVKALEIHKEVWWNVNGEIRALHAYNKIRVPFIKDGILKNFPEKAQNVNSKHPLKDTTILEIGCGGGILCEEIAKLGADVDGVDASGDLIEIAKDHASENPELNNLHYIHTTIEEHAKNNMEKYDAIVASEVIEHIEQKHEFIQNCIQTLKPGGLIFFTTFNKTFLAWFYGIILAENVFKFIPKGTHEWRLFISYDDLTEILKKYGCKTIEIKGISYNFTKNEWTWKNHKRLSYSLQAVKELKN